MSSSLLIAARMAVVDEVAKIKQPHGLPARLDERVEAVVRHVRAKAELLRPHADQDARLATAPSRD